MAPAEVRKVVQKGALNIKTDARKRITGLRHAPFYPLAIGYDSKETPTGASAEIGPDKEKKQGDLGNILELGTPKNAPRPHLVPALAAEGPRFERALEALGVRLLEKP